MDEASESLLTQILLVVQEVQISIESFEKRLNEAKVVMETLNRRIDSIVEVGFPKGDLKSHRIWHEDQSLPAWKRAVLSFLFK